MQRNLLFVAELFTSVTSVIDISWQHKMTYVFLPLRKGNIFTPVCDSVRGAGCLLCLGSRGDVHPPGRHPPRRPLQRTVRILLECILVSFIFLNITCENERLQTSRPSLVRALQACIFHDLSRNLSKHKASATSREDAAVTKSCLFANTNTGTPASFSSSSNCSNSCEKEYTTSVINYIL